MKKITFTLLALISGSIYAQSEAIGTATVNAEVVSPISITSDANMNFGKLIGISAGGTVTLKEDGTRTFSDNNIDAPSTGVSAAAFTIKAANSYSYTITIPDATLSDGTNSMSLSFTNSLGATSTGTGADQSMNVGGILTLNANQPEGTYTGDVEVTVAYE